MTSFYIILAYLTLQCESMLIYLTLIKTWIPEKNHWYWYTGLTHCFTISSTVRQAQIIQKLVPEMGN